MTWKIEARKSIDRYHRLHRNLTLRRSHSCVMCGACACESGFVIRECLKCQLSKSNPNKRKRSREASYLLSSLAFPFSLFQDFLLPKPILNTQSNPIFYCLSVVFFSNTLSPTHPPTVCFGYCSSFSSFRYLSNSCWFFSLSCHHLLACYSFLMSYWNPF